MAKTFISTRMPNPAGTLWNAAKPCVRSDRAKTTLFARKMRTVGRGFATARLATRERCANVQFVPRIHADMEGLAWEVNQGQGSCACVPLEEEGRYVKMVGSFNGQDHRCASSLELEGGHKNFC